jgi:hypothetical protein
LPCPWTGHSWRLIDAVRRLVLLCVPFQTPSYTNCTNALQHIAVGAGCEQTVHSKSDWVTSSFGTADRACC